MTSTQRADIDRMVESGQAVTQGVVPELDPQDARIAQLWSDLRSFTPGDQPISLAALAIMVGEDAVHDVRPIIQRMEQAYFAWQNNRREEERKKTEAKARARRGGKRR